MSALLGLLALPLACATRLSPPEAVVEEMDELSDELAVQGLESMRRYEARLREVSDPLRLHAAPLCAEEIVPYLGVILEVVGQGRPTPLDRVQRLRGVAVSPTVVRVIADSPAAQAGLQPNDVIRSMNGRRVISHEDLLGRLEADRAEAPRLEIERAGVREQVALLYRPACTPPAVFTTSGNLTTWRYSSRVVVTQGLMDFVRNDDELAILIAHEMAHEIIGYGLGRSTREIESRADRISLDLALRAGYDVRGAAALWERLAVQRPWMITTHRDAEKRSGLAYHGDVAARSVRMPDVVAELASTFGAEASSSGPPPSEKGSAPAPRVAR